MLWSRCAKKNAIRYYDTSAVISLYLKEQASPAAQKALAQDFGQLVSSIITRVELRSALARLELSGAIDTAQATKVFSEAQRDLDAAPRRLELSEDVLKEATRLFGATVLPLRTLDALHIATCLRYGTSGFVTNDKQQARVAQSVGLSVEYLSGTF